MYFEGSGIDGPVRLYVLVIVVPGEFSVDNLDATNLDDAVVFSNFQTGSFCVQYYLTYGFIHRSLFTAL